MPRSRHAMGRPNAVAIPPDWEATHAHVIEGTFDCTVSIGPAGTSSRWVEEEKKTRTLPVTAVYSGAASITPIAQDTQSQPEMAEDIVPVRRYEVKLEHATDLVAVGHVITVSDAPDPALTRLKVTGVEKASRRFSRVLTAVEAD